MEIKINNETLLYNNLIYVSKTGSDVSGDGSKYYPYNTISKAISSIVQDNTGIIIREGRYQEEIKFNPYGLKREHSLFRTDFAYDIIGIGMVIIETVINKDLSYIFSLSKKSMNVYNVIINVNITTGSGASAWTNCIYSDNGIENNFLKVYNSVIYFIPNQHNRAIAYSNKNSKASFFNCVIDMGELSPSYSGHKNGNTPTDLINCVLLNLKSFKSAHGDSYSCHISLSNTIEVNSDTNGVNITRLQPVVAAITLDKNYSILGSTLWKNTGIGKNPNGSQANIGIYGGPFCWFLKYKILLKSKNKFYSIKNNSLVEVNSYDDIDKEVFIETNDLIKEKNVYEKYGEKIESFGIGNVHKISINIKNIKKITIKEV